MFLEETIRRFAVLFFLAFLVCCSSQQEGLGDLTISRELPTTKQKQRIGFLKRKLELAEKAREKIDEQIARLKEEISQTQLSLIRKRVDEYEKEMQLLEGSPMRYAAFLRTQNHPLFLKEREELHDLIQSESAPGAHALLDRILRLITLSSDGE